MIEMLTPLGKYKYDASRILPVKYYIDNSVRLLSYIRDINSLKPNCTRSLRDLSLSLVFLGMSSNVPMMLSNTFFVTCIKSMM
jgi:hypothetical protein